METCYNGKMPQDFDSSRYSELLREAKKAFLADSAYAIAVAKPAGALAARVNSAQSEVDESPSNGV